MYGKGHQISLFVVKIVNFACARRYLQYGKGMGIVRVATHVTYTKNIIIIITVHCYTLYCSHTCNQHQSTHYVANFSPCRMCLRRGVLRFPLLLSHRVCHRGSWLW